MLANYANAKRRLEHKIYLLYSKRVEGQAQDLPLPTQEFKKEYDNLKKQLKEINNNIEEIEKKQKGKLSEETLKQIMTEFKDGRQFDNEILKKLINRVEVYEDRTISITLNI